MRLEPRTTPPADGPAMDLLPARNAEIAPGVTVRRALPHRHRRAVGPWCFLDHFGPAPRGALDVAPHPHTCLSTVTWLFAGEILHKDSLGTEQVIRPGQVNWMTAGRGISHSEELAPGYQGPMHGVQLWVALPDATRFEAPSFRHHADLPVAHVAGADVTVVAGTCGDVTSPVATHSPLVAAEVRLDGAASLPLRVDFEHAVLPIDGDVDVDGEIAGVGTLVYLGTGRERLSLSGAGRVMLVGGLPLGEDLLLWWNFGGRSDAEIRTFRAAWEAADPRFGSVDAYDGARLAAPPLP